MDFFFFFNGGGKLGVYSGILKYGHSYRAYQFLMVPHTQIASTGTQPRGSPGGRAAGAGGSFCRGYLPQKNPAGREPFIGLRQLALSPGIHIGPGMAWSGKGRALSIPECHLSPPPAAPRIPWAALRVPPWEGAISKCAVLRGEKRKINILEVAFRDPPLSF